MWISSIKIINILPGYFGPYYLPDLLSILSSIVFYTSSDVVLEERFINNLTYLSSDNTLLR